MSIFYIYSWNKQKIKPCISGSCEKPKKNLIRGQVPMRPCSFKSGIRNWVENILKKACRPTVRVNKDTTITIQELLELHSVKDLIKAAEKKNNDMRGRMMWKDLKFTASKTA